MIPRHAQPQVQPPAGVPVPAAPGTLAAPRPGQPPTLSLVLSRRARRDAAEAAARYAVPDPRLEVVERVFTGFQVGGNVLALVLSAVAWVWVAAHRSDVAVAGESTGPASLPGLAAFSGISGSALVLIMLPTCLLMAPSVNPFYLPPAQHRWLHTGRTAAFVLLALSTVAVIAGAAG